MNRPTALLLSALGFLTVTACAGTGEVIPLKLHAASATDKSSQAVKELRVAVSPFEDERAFKTGLGTRSHLWGGVSYFDLGGGKPGNVVAQALSEFLTSKGWHVVKPGSGEEADVTLTGRILELLVHAKSRFMMTELTAKTKFAMTATNSSDKSIVRMTLDGSGDDEKFWFDNEHIEALLNDVLTDSFKKLPQDTKVENNMLRLK